MIIVVVAVLVIASGAYVATRPGPVSELVVGVGPKQNVTVGLNETVQLQVWATFEGANVTLSSETRIAWFFMPGPRDDPFLENATLGALTNRSGPSTVFQADSIATWVLVLCSVSFEKVQKTVVFNVTIEAPPVVR